MSPPETASIRRLVAVWPYPSTSRCWRPRARSGAGQTSTHSSPSGDGWRALVYVLDALSPCGPDAAGTVSEKVPEFGRLARTLGGRAAVLDGELIASSGAPSSFYRIAGHVSGRGGLTRQPLTFVVFDFLYLDGDLTKSPYGDRRQSSEELNFLGPTWCTTPSYVGLGAELFAACTALGLEGASSRSA